MKQKVLKGVIAVLLFLIPSILVGILIVSTKPVFNESDYDISVVEVCSGDTLWDYAELYKTEDTDPRYYISAVCELNGKTDTTIYIGEILKIYVAKENK